MRNQQGIKISEGTYNYPSYRISSFLGGDITGEGDDRKNN